MQVLDLVRGNKISLVQTVYSGEEYEITEHCPFEQDNPTVLPFDDCSFDGVFSYAVLNAYSWRDSVAVVKDWARVLKPEGVLHILVPSQRWLGKLMMQHTVQPQMRPLLFGDQTDYAGSASLSSYTLLDLRVHIEASGLRLVVAKTGQYTVDMAGQRYDAEQLYVAGVKDG